jgi:hypothetical protein
LVFFVLYWEITHQYAYLAPDSFTYFAMARHWKESGAWFSYSGLDKTTGIHLGYYLLLLPFTWLAGVGEPGAALFPVSRHGKIREAVRG